jgi:hypothetical protein
MPEPGDCALFQILRFIVDAVFLQKKLQFFDEWRLSVTFLLRLNVTPDIRPATGADGECGIALLPCKPRAMIARSPN